MKLNLEKLLKMQSELDNHILNRFPNLRNVDLLPQKLLALQVELGELAQNWRGFKFWSKDQEPRTKLFTWINGIGECVESKRDPRMLAENLQLNAFRIKNPLLEEYVDCLHFILSIGLEIGYTEFDEEKMNEYFAQVSEEEQNDITGHFISINYITSCILENEIHYEQAFFEILSLGERLGFTWEQIEEAYYAKNQINHARQESGY